MPAASTLAASCVALSTAITQILIEAANFARQVRQARHDVNAINSELLAIKTSLEIIHVDFISTSASFPQPFLDAVWSILECCTQMGGQVHKMIIQLSASHFQRESWDTHRKNDSAKLRRHLESLHIVLDVALDQISIFTLPSLHSNSPPASGRNSRLECDRKLVRELCQQIDTERERIRDRAENELLGLECSLSELRKCAKATLEGSTAHGGASKRSDSPQEDQDPPQSERNNSAQSSRSTSTDIGAWIDNVASHIVPTSPDHSRRLVVSVSQSRDGLQPSPSTFYTESSTSGSNNAEKTKRTKSRPRSIRPQPITEGTLSHRLTPFLPSPTAVSVASVPPNLKQYIDPDKVAIARAARLELSSEQTAALDDDLRNIDRSTPHATVERMLWQGADPNVADSIFGFTFIRAAFDLSPIVIHLLLEYGANIMKTSTTEYYSALHAAVLGCQLENVRYFVRLEMPIDALNHTGESALHIAAKTPGAYPIAKYLLEMGADVNMDSEGAGTPLHTALVANRLDSRERTKIVELLMAHGAEGDLNEREGWKREKGLSVLGLI